MEVYNTLGYGFLEVVYKDAMEIEFLEQEMEYTGGKKNMHCKIQRQVLKHKFFADLHFI